MQLSCKNKARKGFHKYNKFKLIEQIILLFLLPTLPVEAIGTVNHSHAATQKPRRLLVLPFHVSSAQDKESLKTQFTGLTRKDLREKGFQVLKKPQVQTLLNQKPGQKLNPERVRLLAELTNSRYGIYGELNQKASSLRIDLELIGTGKGNLTKSLDITQMGAENISRAAAKTSKQITEYINKIIISIEITGNELMETSAIKSRLQIETGKYFIKDKIDAEVKRLYDSGFFEDVKVFVRDTASGKKIIFKVREKPLIQNIAVQGNKQLEDSEILGKIETQTGKVLNTETLSQDLRKIKKLYRKEGHYKVNVSYKQKQIAPGKAKLILQIKEGRKLYIQNITIKGANKLSAENLKDRISLSERGLFSWITGSGVLKKKQLHRDVAILKSYCSNRGFIDVQVAQPEVKFTREGIDITFFIQEGERYKVKDVSIKGDLISPEKKLLELTKLQDLASENNNFDRSVMNSDRQNLTEYYANYGYAHASTNVDLEKNPQNNTVSVTYIINKKKKVFIRKLTISGNTKTRDHVIRREMDLVGGEQFSGKELSDSKQNLNKLGYFKSVNIDTVPTGKPNKMDLKVDVKEKSTGSFSAGAGYSSVDNIFLTAQVRERNFLGRGYDLSLLGKYSSESTRFQFSFWNPHLYNGPLGIGVDAYDTSWDYDEYDLLNTGGRLKFAYTIGDYTRLHWNVDISKYEVDDIESGASESIKAIQGKNWSRTISVSAKRGTTNKYYAPTKGSKNTLHLEYAGGLLGGDDNFLKTEYDFSYYYTPWWKLTFNWRWNAGWLFENTGEEIPDFERFYLGGLHSVRGYEHRDISCKDSQGNDIGGYKSFQNNIEVNFPVTGSDLGLRGTLFFDAGNVWDKDESVSLDFYKSYGVGMSWNSPMGPIEVVYAIPMDDLEDNSAGFQFSVGGAF